jgi:hypothetical protein
LVKISSDYKDLLKSLNAAGVRYLIVGGYAVMIYTEPRYTKDLDIWVDTASANAQALFQTLKAFGAPLAGISPRDFTAADVFYQLGVEPVRIDVMTSLPGLTFSAAWPNRNTIDFDGEPAHVISREDLVRSKAALNKPKKRKFTGQFGWSAKHSR